MRKGVWCPKFVRTKFRHSKYHTFLIFSPPPRNHARRPHPCLVPSNRAGAVTQPGLPPAAFRVTWDAAGCYGTHHVTWWLSCQCDPCISCALLRGVTPPPPPAPIAAPQDDEIWEDLQTQLIAREAKVDPEAAKRRAAEEAARKAQEEALRRELEEAKSHAEEAERRAREEADKRALEEAQRRCVAGCAVKCH